MSCVTFHIAVCTCARADPISVSQKRLDRSRSDLLCGWEPIICYLITCHGLCVYLHVPPCNYKTGVRISGIIASIVLKIGLLLGVHISIIRNVPPVVTHVHVHNHNANFGTVWSILVSALCREVQRWRFARLAVCAFGGLRVWWFTRLAV